MFFPKEYIYYLRGNFAKIFEGKIVIKITGPVVQLNRTSDSGSEGRGFESLRGH